MFDDVRLSIMLATFIIFLAMIIILNSLLYKPLLEFIDQRNKSIESDEKKVKQNSEEMSNFNDEFDKIKQSTREEINAIKQKALNEAKQEAEKELENKKQELEQKMQIFYAQLAQDRANFEQELKISLPAWQEALKNNLKNI
ncbi:F0F1 ATP synthase subunit B' [Campylobacter sp. MIT 12-8780]|uniref:F0F1 ATP synthase subunit B family protein n=1 Tax=unclassified Campylobacter TaxID=2593542 RepID=UPI0010F7F761|nr:MULTISPECIES: F0F1 ATP synthase subunit B' [unclassified Campylobacter]NDJ27381.1 F0F1 ATP synthase subunit B' [Campylobacter sp. MIT 19-121]TKX28506.1 F0F1 ATP synthase subunit B' [Campylobacter sp. MIT 12-5580]TQR40228.1 F0F1 ATP synthase subunit B' [Campylobacter sp. MIT 12-8780]